MKCRGFAATATLLLLLCSQALGARHLAAQTPLPEEIETCCEALAAIGFTSELPVFILDTLGHNVTTKGKNVDVAWCTCPMGNKAYKAQNGTAVASVHGNSSAKFAKKSFNFKTTHPDGSKDSKSLLGMPKESKWVLYGNDEADLTRGMRDFVTYNLARASGEYATRTVWTEVFVVSDGAALSMDDYYGLYILEEKVDRDADRVDIPKWTPEDPSGGYIFAFVHGDYNSGEPTTKVIERFDFPFVIKYPTPSDAANASLSETWLTNYLSSFQAAVMADDYLTATSPSYLDFMELDTFIDFFLLTELTKSPDGYRDSIYMHKGLGQRFSMGPAWDYNEAYGECCGFPIEGYEQNGKSAPGIAGGSAISPNGWRFLICEDAERCLAEPDDGVSFWFRRLWNDTRFSGPAAERWMELRAGAWSNDAIFGLIDNTTQLIKPAMYRDLEASKDIILKSWYPNVEVQWNTEMSNFENWIMERVSWLDAEFALVAAGQYVYPVSNSLQTPAVEQVAAAGITSAPSP